MRQMIFLIAGLILTFSQAIAEPTAATSWSADAKKLYDEGFMHMLMRGQEGIMLFNRDLIENDSPGAGMSEKGVHTDVVWGKNRARKVFLLDEVRAEKAWIVIYLTSPFGKYPLRFSVNGHPAEYKKWVNGEYLSAFSWLEIDPSWLKKGKNIVDIFSPEAQTEKDGWTFIISRADEFEAGGGSPADVGKTSFKSTDGGETWKESPFGPLGQTRAEYTVRISFDRFVKTGWVATPVLDLWKGDSDNFYVSQHRLSKLAIGMDADVPAGTKVEYYLRKGTNPNPFSSEWEPYELIGSGAKLDFTADPTFIWRFVQIRAVLATDNPLASPVVKNVRVNAEITDAFPYPAHRNIVVVETDNPLIKYSSLNWEWEKWDRPEFAELRSRENLDEVVAGSESEFEAQVRIMDYATKRWTWQPPSPGYPEWDALSILNRLNKMGGGGMCIQFNNYLAGLFMAFGWQAHLVNVDGHEECEVWNDEFGKWIYMEATHYNHYLYDRPSGIPMNTSDLHKVYLDYFYPGKTIDWSTLTRPDASLAQLDSIIGRGSLTDQRIKSLLGFNQATFMRMVPRNNFYEKPHPRPLCHGNISWPWNGYINWYDSRTPPKRQYSWFTDRERDMWPDLNTTHIYATSALGNDRLYLQFESYTPNFSHFEVQVNGAAWKQVDDQWTWLFHPGKNALAVRAVSKVGVKGRPSTATVIYAPAPFQDPMNPEK
jgi:hypothetical protein